MNCKLFLSAITSFAGVLLSAAEPLIYEEDYSRFELEKPYPRFHGAVIRQEKGDDNFRYMALKAKTNTILLDDKGFYANDQYTAMHIRARIRFPKFEPETIPGITPPSQSITFGMRNGDAKCFFTLRPLMTIFKFNTLESVSPEAKKKRAQAISEGKRNEWDTFYTRQNTLLKQKMDPKKWYDLDIRISDSNIRVVLQDAGEEVVLLEKNDLVPGSGGISISTAELVEVGPVSVTVPEAC